MSDNETIKLHDYLKNSNSNIGLNELFELQCPRCNKWTGIQTTDKYLFPMTLNSFCPFCEEVMNYYTGESNSYVEGETQIIELVPKFWVNFRKAREKNE